MKIKVVSLFAGCGGLDLGFKMAGFNIIWANEFDKTIHKTYESNHPGTFLDKRDIRKIPSNEIPDCVGIIGGPPCQSWSEAGAQRGINDTRGKLFFEYIRVLRDKKPLFFLAENVSGMFHARHKEAFQQILSNFQSIGYNVSYKLINAKYYNVPQDRRRLFFIGYRKDLGKTFFFENIQTGSRVLTLKDAIWDLRKSAKPALAKNHTNGYKCKASNHEYMVGGFSTIYMSRNRVRGWGEPSYTIQAGGRHAPIHPQANKMIKIEKNKWVFDPASPSEYRRLTIRECARVQTFPDSFIFYYNGVADGYKMIGNAVPVNLAYTIATTIRKDLEETINKIKKVKTKYGFETTPKRSKTMSRIKSINTKPEVSLRKKLWAKGYRYRKNYKNLPGKPDIVFTKEKIAVFIDGEFWHGYNWAEKKKKIKSNASYWIPKIEKNIKRDKEITKKLEDSGWDVIRLWGHEVNKNVDKNAGKIISCLKSKRKHAKGKNTTN